MPQDISLTNTNDACFLLPRDWSGLIVIVAGDFAQSEKDLPRHSNGSTIGNMPENRSSLRTASRLVLMLVTGTAAHTFYCCGRSYRPTPERLGLDLTSAWHSKRARPIDDVKYPHSHCGFVMLMTLHLKGSALVQRPGRESLVDRDIRLICSKDCMSQTPRHSPRDPCKSSLDHRKAYFQVRR